MHTKLLATFDHLVLIRTGALADVVESDKKYDQPKGSWSMAQVMHHLYLTEKGCLQYMSKKIAGLSNLGPSSVKSKVLLELLFVTYFFQLKFKAPDVVAHPSNEHLDQLKDQWDATSQQFRKFLEENSGSIGNRAIFRHPFTGLLNLNETLRFLVDHFEHHQGQLKRIRKRLENSHS